MALAFLYELIMIMKKIQFMQEFIFEWHFGMEAKWKSGETCSARSFGRLAVQTVGHVDEILQSIRFGRMVSLSKLSSVSHFHCVATLTTNHSVIGSRSNSRSIRAYFRELEFMHEVYSSNSNPSKQARLPINFRSIFTLMAFCHEIHCINFSTSIQWYSVIPLLK